MARKRLKAATAVLATAILAGGVTTVPVEAQETYRVSGNVFHDLNMNGINDDGVERFRQAADFYISLRVQANQGLKQEAHLLNIAPDSYGNYTISNVAPGNYRIMVTTNNWGLTTPSDSPSSVEESNY